MLEVAILLFMEADMNKETIKKATFKDLVAKKLQRDEDKFKTKDIYVQSLDSTLTFKKPDDDLILETIDAIGEDRTNTKSIVEAFKKLIYQCCDMLQDTELHKELEVQDPFDTVSKIFDVMEIMDLGDKLSDFVNINGKIDDIKN